jgi:hypothetical protein
MPHQNINLVCRPEKMPEWCGVVGFAPGKRVDVTLKPNMMLRRSGENGMNQQSIRAEITGDASCCDECLLFGGLFHKRVDAA